MKTLLLTLTYSVGIGELILAIYFWVTNSKSEVRRVMAVLSAGTGLWALTNALTGLSSVPNDVDKIFASLTFVCGLVLLTSLFHLAIIYPFRSWSIDRWHVIGLYSPIIPLSYAILFTRTFLTELPITNNASGTIGGPLFPLLNIYYGILFVSSLILLVAKSIKLDGSHKRNLLIIFWTVLLGGLPGIIFAVLHWFSTLQFNYLYGPIASIAWIGAITWIISRK